MQSWEADVVLLPQQECYTTSENLMNLRSEHTGWFIATQLACKHKAQQLCPHQSACARPRCRGRLFSYAQCLQKLWLFSHIHLTAVLSYRSLGAFRIRECFYGGKKAAEHPSLTYPHFHAVPEVNC